MIRALSLILPLTYAAGMSASLQATPNTVSAVSTVSLILKLNSLVGVPTKGGIRVTVPSSFGSKVQCDIVDPTNVSLVQDPLSGSRCQLLSANQVQMTLSTGSLSPATTVFIQASLFNNPTSTGKNSGFSVSTFDSNGVVTSSIADLSLTSLQPKTMEASLKA